MAMSKKNTVSDDVEQACRDFSKVAASFVPKDCGFIFVAFRQSDPGTALISNLTTEALMAKFRELAAEKGPSYHEDISRNKPS